MAEMEPRRVLIVEDDEALLKTNQQLLEMEGYAVETAASAPEAGEKIEQTYSNGEEFDALLLDYNFPNYPGSQKPAPTEVYLKLREAELIHGLGRAGIAAYSASSEIDVTRTDYGIPDEDERRFTGFRKPFDIDTLINAVEYSSTKG